MKKFLFLDLDDTVFQTLRKCGNVQGLRPAAYLKDQTPISYSTPRQQALLACFMEEMTVIPTTARSVDAYRRVDLPFGQIAILNFGGVILDEQGKPDESWLKEISDRLLPFQNQFEYLKTQLDSFCEANKLDISIRIIADLDINFYVVAKHRQGNIAELQGLLHDSVNDLVTALSPSFTIQFNDNNLAIIPAFLNKVIGVNRLIEKLRSQHGEIITFAMGDSTSDADFMAACDYAIVPRLSQLHRYLFAKQHV